MIRTACFAVLVAGTLLTSQGASATVNLNDRISQIVKGLENAHFSGRDFSFTLSVGRPKLFTGIEGVRLLNGTDLTELNDWADDLPSSNSVFNGGNYHFTHGVLDSFFGGGETGAGTGTGTETSTNPVFEGEPYKFTHEVLDSYFEEEETTPPTPQSLVVEQPTVPVAVPEPASWAMMIGGFALAGAAMRTRRTLRIA